MHLQRTRFETLHIPKRRTGAGRSRLAAGPGRAAPDDRAGKSIFQPPSYLEPACPAQLHGARRETSPVGIECVGLEQRLDIAAREPQRLSDAPTGQCAVFDEAVNGRAAHPQMTDDLRDGEERLQTKLISQMTSRLRSSSCFRTGRSCLSGTVGSRRISWFTGGPDAFDKIKTAEENASKSNTLDVRMERRIEHLAE